MLGAQIEEGRGKRTARRVIATQPNFKVEVSFEAAGALLGQQGMNIGTYVSSNKSDGALSGEGRGVFATLDGDIVTWRAIGVGRLGEGGALSYCGSLTYDTASPKLAKLNGIAGVFQFQVDPEGNTHSQTWELQPASVGRSATAA